ncbi:MAG: LamG-like jellyroll fold domain-containing protein [Rariglobus sp.]|nr:LamG-like jellyroll fold domain-containing protein [Rariglobus sp.]
MPQDCILSYASKFGGFAVPRLVVAACGPLVGGWLALVCLAGTEGRASDLPHRSELVLELRFNDAPGEVVKDSAAKNPPALMTIFDGAKADLRTAPGGGVSHKPKDRAFDNTVSLAMGGSGKTPGQGGKAVISGGATSFDRAMSFTVQGWYKSDGVQIPSNYARLISSQRLSVVFDGPDGKGLVLSTDRGSALSPSPVFRVADQWVFFAITYDGAGEYKNVVFYAGSVNGPVQVVTEASLAAGALKTVLPDVPVIIGNMPAGDRPFDGVIDNIRIWADAASSEAVLNQAELEAIRRADTS